MSEQDSIDDFKLSEAIAHLENALNAPMTPEVGRLVAESDQLRSRLRDRPDLIAAAAERTGVTEADLREWVYQVQNEEDE